MKRSLLTLYPTLKNVHLVKDVGMIPFILQQFYDYDVTIATYNNEAFPFLETEVKGLKVVFIKKITGFELLDSILYLIIFSRKYNILQVYHFKIFSLIYCLCFKILKVYSYSVTYLKLDANDDILTLSYQGIKRILMNFFLARLDIVTVETARLQLALNQNNLFGQLVHLVPNGFYTAAPRKDYLYKNKVNKIVTVGRIGTFHKNNETLLEGFNIFSTTNPDWTLEVIGPIEDSFKPFIEAYFQRYPHLMQRVVFTGAVYDRELLGKKYADSKLFVLSSLRESFGLVYLEAMEKGCYVISSDITPAYDVTQCGKFGSLFPVGNAVELANCLEYAVQHEQFLEEICPRIQDFVHTNFYWPVIGGKLDLLLKEKL